MEGVFLVANDDGMSGVGPPGKTNNNLGFVGQVINNFSFPFIAPLGSYNDNFHRRLASTRI
jgi:hypothetical protein